MKGKKLIAALIAVAMVLSTMTFTVFAEETETVAAIEDTEFATNSDAAEELTTMTVEEETFDDNLLLTKEGGTVLEEGTDYTVSYGSYYYNGTHQAYKIYNIKSSVTDITISGGVAYSHDWYPTMFFKSNVVIASNTIANIILDDVVLGAIQVGSNSSATFTLVGDNNVSSIAGESTSQLIFEGEGSLTSDHIGGKSVYGSDVGCPAITINSGTYTITPSSSYAAAIGGGQSSSATNGITINGGTIIATSNYGAAIGGG
jgi:hypothetical protein